MADELNVGDKAPNFSMTRDGGETLALKDFKGRNLVLYFYPKDDTPGCTKEAIAFTQAKADFAGHDTDIIGVSRDTVAKHEKFAAKHDLGIALGADEDGAVTEAYGVWKEKKMYGKVYMGIERSTFLIDGKGVIQGVWRKVKVPGHVDAVLDAAKEL